MAIQLQAFAERVLFGTTLEDKLAFPREEIVDTKPGDAIRTPKRLPRPQHLTLRHKGERVAPPGHAKLIDEKERGRLLHFFGNHELLATELMALALLKFPNAPASFRQGVLETLKEEQIHTRLYIHRMEQCGVEFGELPLSDYFWKSVSSMEDPLDYVTRLSLTFEQANLDYSREYGKCFDQVGDSSTASILDKIYHDEIEHVGFGLKWFRRWKAAGKSDWEAFQERLVFPLSPARAKGNHFNKEGRREAGLDSAFIHDLELFQQSRGRTPTVWWFNPDAETYAALPINETSPVALSPLQTDLAFLPAYLSRKDDILILPDRPSQKFLKQLSEYGFPLPEIQLCQVSQGTLQAPELDRKIGALKPWAWTPDSISFFQNTFSSLTRRLNSDTLWNPKRRACFSKVWSADWGRNLPQALDHPGWLAPAAIYGQPVCNPSELSTVRQQFADPGYRNLVCKAPFATAAQGNRCLMDGEEVSPKLLDWLTLIWQEQKQIVVEPWLERVFDFSVQMEYREKELKVLGFTRLINNPRGQFMGIITHGFCDGLDKETTRFLMSAISGKPRIYQWYENTLAPQLEPALEEMGYTGPIGLDAFVYRDPSGQLKLKPVVEINPRFTMGRLALELGRHLAPGAKGCFQILTKSQMQKKGWKGFTSFTQSLQNQYPVELTEEPRSHIKSGSIPLTDPSMAKQFLAVYHIRRHIKKLPIF